VKAAIVLVVALLIVLLGCAAAGGAGAAGQKRLSVLFVGNSLTASNDLPGMVAAIARGVGHTSIDVQMVAPGGYALEDHWANGTALEAIRSGRFDVVVLQQGPSSLPESRVNLIDWTQRFADEARAHGTRPAVLTVWPERERFSVFADVVRNYRDAARASNALLLPAGAAWRNAFRRRPAIRLYGPDAFHPSPLGTYLAALVAYTGLTGELPRSLPAAGGVKPTGRTAVVLRAATSDLWP
jgi:hypothetical protein